MQAQSDILSQYKSLSKTPYPAYTFAGSLLISPLFKPITAQVAASNASLGSSMKFLSRNKSQLLLTHPSRATILLFAGANALGGFMIQDNDLVNGSMFLAAWNVLFSIVSLRRMKLISVSNNYPKLLLAFSLSNAYLYGTNLLA